MALDPDCLSQGDKVIIPNPGFSRNNNIKNGVLKCVQSGTPGDTIEQKAEAAVIIIENLSPEGIRNLSTNRRKRLRDEIAAAQKINNKKISATAGRYIPQEEMRKMHRAKLSYEKTLLKIWRAKREPDIKNALDEQKKTLEAKKQELQRWDDTDKATFRKWFGTDGEPARKQIEEMVDKMLNLNKNTTIDNFVDGRDGFLSHHVSTTYAFVQPNDTFFHNVHLCHLFDKAPATGTDSKAETLTHEMSHFSDIGDTDDHAYGVRSCKRLAKKKPSDALNNADSFAYYCSDSR